MKSVQILSPTYDPAAESSMVLLTVYVCSSDYTESLTEDLIHHKWTRTFMPKYTNAEIKKPPITLYWGKSELMNRQATLFSTVLSRTHK